jgi:predicted permease
VDWQQLLDDVQRVPAVKSAALTDIVPMREGENVLGYSATAAIPSSNELPQALASAVTPDYIAVMRLPLLKGRFFDRNDTLDNTQVVVIDENLARHTFGNGDPVGKLLWVPAMGKKPVQVVGVVGHVRNWGLAGDDLSRIHDQIYYPLAQVPDKLVRLFSSIISIVIRTDVPPLDMLQALQMQVRGTTGDQTLYEVRTMEQLASASLSQQRFLLLLFGVFSGLALLLACVGIYSVVAYFTSQRVPEFGVRIAVGANSVDILRLVLRDSLVMIFAGIGTGVLVSIATERVVQRLVLVAQASLVSTFALVLPVLIAVALLASYIPARRAAKVDPMVALRYE